MHFMASRKTPHFGSFSKVQFETCRRLASTDLCTGIETMNKRVPLLLHCNTLLHLHDRHACLPFRSRDAGPLTQKFCRFETETLEMEHKFGVSCGCRKVHLALWIFLKWANLMGFRWWPAVFQLYLCLCFAKLKELIMLNKLNTQAISNRYVPQSVNTMAVSNTASIVFSCKSWFLQENSDRPLLKHPVYITEMQIDSPSRSSDGLHSCANKFYLRTRTVAFKTKLFEWKTACGSAKTFVVLT